MAPIKVLKRYTNRRLYDSELRRYITFFDVRRMVIANTPFVVRDHHTQVDHTQEVLLKTLLACAPNVPRPLLLQLIRTSG